MKKTIAILLAAICGFVIVGKFTFYSITKGNTEKLTNAQNRINQAQTARIILQNLASRLAVESKTDPAMAQLMRQHGISIEIDGVKYPQSQ
ncbi:MAG: hypothetical protein NZM04_01180 [Methylacidiphilales bacterium]|nr:hypothetical protein [Candidatus Methylacidiphilales bacterium]MDW8349777.1 hypothetical protein [Verrucomicrobiae bacterium]